MARQHKTFPLCRDGSGGGGPASGGSTANYSSVQTISSNCALTKQESEFDGCLKAEREKKGKGKQDGVEGVERRIESAATPLSLSAIVAYHMIKAISYWSGTGANSSAM